ncbi:single-stranded DNA-binding protein [Eubacteriales bacterium OttesenSCG-928-N14]|nr:single-stranded DNA-binding protein [Eubacteriales bacterium OttesenSCG-928-N14]
MNKAILIGNLTRDPDLRMTNSGISVCTFSIAVQRRFANQAGERPADFFNIVTWRGLAENCGKYLKKGSKVGVCGSIQNRNYDAADGTKRYVTEIVADEVEFLDRANRDGEGGGRPNASEPSPFDADVEFGDAVDDDELPF